MARVINKIYRIKLSYEGARILSSSSYQRPDEERKSKLLRKIIIGSTFVGIVRYYLKRKRIYNEKQKGNIELSDVSVETDNFKGYCEESDGQCKGNAIEVYKGGRKIELPYYSIEEVIKHRNKNTGIWVSYKGGVYDITKYIDRHPGGDQILLAAGGAMEPFWLIYPRHNSQHVHDILEKFRIGNLKEGVHSGKKDPLDPYNNEPVRHSAMIIPSLRPFNGAGPPELLVDSYYTPTELFFVRNHLPVAAAPDLKTYKLGIEVEGTNTVASFSMDELMKMPKQTIAVTLMCVGNRRSEMSNVKIIKSLLWNHGAIGNATWSGVWLRDVLKKAGFNEKDEDKFAHVQFESLDKDAAGKSFSTSIPIWRALDKRADVMLAYEMNGLPLTRDHGYPLRIIAPGVAGVRCTKRLSRVIVSHEESDCHWQRTEYKGFGPSVDWDTADFKTAQAAQELPIISAICTPTDSQNVRLVNGKLVVKGYAWCGGGLKVIRVDVTGDGGKTWHVAKFDHQDSALPPKHWTWTLWSVSIPVEKSAKTVELWAKAVDSSYGTQPEGFEFIWNIRGIVCNAYHRITVNII